MREFTFVDSGKALDIVSALEKEKDIILSEFQSKYVSNPTLDTQIDFELLFDTIVDRLKRFSRKGVE